MTLCGMDSTDFALPSWQQRLKLIGVFLALFAWAQSHQLWMPALAEQVRSGCGCEVLWPARALAIYFVLLPVPLAVASAWFAQKVHRSGQVPPPGTWLFFRTRIRRGAWAKSAAAFYAAAGLALSLLPGVIAYGMDLSYLFCVAESCECRDSAANATSSTMLRSAAQCGRAAGMPPNQFFQPTAFGGG